MGCRSGVNAATVVLRNAFRRLDSVNKSTVDGDDVVPGVPALGGKSCIGRRTTPRNLEGGLDKAERRGRERPVKSPRTRMARIQIS
eukprot:scaffold3247_cov44-Cyclotella_meneghiniana.AAC.3